MKMYLYLKVPLVFLITSVSADDAKNMPNINYFTRGYNILKGNPLQVSVSVLDPGFQQSIFQLSYEEGSITPDGRYLQPDGTLISMCKSCSLAFGTRKISGMHAYRKSLSEKASISTSFDGFFGLTKGSFSVSVDYQNVKSKTSDKSYLFTHSDASCCAYQIQTNTYTPPPFSQDFLAGVKTLTEYYDKRIYTRFINAFGTHYIQQANMGSSFGQQCMISKEAWKGLLKQGVDIDVAASFSADALVFSSKDSANSKTNIHTEHVQKFNNYSSSQTLYTKGSQPPKNGSIYSWIDQTKDYPAPISLELASILDLLNGINVTSAVRSNMDKALKAYCGENCDDYEVDPPFPYLNQWQPWLTDNSIGERGVQFSCIDMTRNSFSYITSIDTSIKLNLSTIDISVRCSTDENNHIIWSGNLWPVIENLHGKNDFTFYPNLQFFTDYNGDMTCIENGFKKIGALVNPFDTINNVHTYCHDDSKQQITISMSNNIHGNWTKWSACNLDEKIVGIQVSAYREDNREIPANGVFGFLNDIRIQCA